MPKSTINSDLVRQLAALLDETGLTEIEYESGAVRLRVVRQPAPVAAAPVAMAAPAPMASAPAADAPAPDARHPGAITSPMVGTAYTQPEPGAAEFVKPGDRVREGQTLLLTEAMKTFNEIRAPRAGTVSRIMVMNEQPVEYGDVLLILE